MCCTGGNTLSTSNRDNGGNAVVDNGLTIADDVKIITPSLAMVFIHVSGRFVVHRREDRLPFDSSFPLSGMIFLVEIASPLSFSIVTSCFDGIVAPLCSEFGAPLFVEMLVSLCFEIVAFFLVEI